MTREDVKKLLMSMEAIFPNYKIKDMQNTLNVWHSLLEDQDTRLIFAALKEYSSTNLSGFAPNVAQLKHGAFELSGGGSMSDSQAWALVSKAISNSAYGSVEEFEKLPPIVQRAVGSPRQLQIWALDEDYSEGVASSNFRRSYSAAVESDRKQALMTEDVKRLIQDCKPRLEEKSDQVSM